MSGWAGLAAGAQMFMQIKMQDKKDALLERLEKDKEQRAQDIKIADEQRAEDRANKKVASTETVLEGGKYVTHKLNANGDVIKSEDADPDEIEKINNAKLKDKLTLENLQNQGALTQKQLATYDADHSLENRVKEAQVGELNRHFNPAYGYGSSRTGGKSPSYTAPTKGSIESHFGTVGDDGKTHVNQAQVEKFSQWRSAHQDIPDGDQALDAYVADMGEDKKYKAGLVSTGVPAPLVDEVGDALKNGGTYVQPKSNVNMTPDVAASRDKGLVMYQRARAAIAKGLLSKEDAKAQLRQQGYPKLAEVLK